ncbi:MAG: CYTH domain-containing protein [Candidatus Symbiothrix sp.]|jgi:CYTH domain-containing protein|nr:CYTH domain-containing protein [Candidatus Symbiothrix sp.]
MNIEIERKFLVKGDFRPFAVRSVRIKQAYLTTDPERTVRVRLIGDKAVLTIKGAGNAKGVSRLEFEYPIPYTDAQEILSIARGCIDKERYYVPCGRHEYEVDVFHGRHEGLIIAELELSSEDEAFDRPDWLGAEVTGKSQYYNANLSASDGADISTTSFDMNNH